MSRLNTLWVESKQKNLCRIVQHVEYQYPVNLEAIPCNNCSSCYLAPEVTDVRELWESINVETTESN